MALVQIDLTWQHIRLLRSLGLARQVRLPAAQQEAATSEEGGRRVG